MDEEWKYNPDQNVIEDNFGGYNNVINVAPLGEEDFIQNQLEISSKLDQTTKS